VGRQKTVQCHPFVVDLHVMRLEHGVDLCIGLGDLSDAPTRALAKQVSLRHGLPGSSPISIAPSTFGARAL
jgi:hypothetical protein